MSSIIRLAVGILGNATSMLMYGAPIITFRRVIRKRSTEDFSGVPYSIALLNCLLYTWYGSPIVSNGSENILVAIVNGIGIILESFFVCTYLIFAPPKTKRTMGLLFVSLSMLFGAIAAVSLFALHDRRHRKLLVGSAGMAVSVVMYGSPLSVIRLVIRTKSVEFMPFYLSLFSFLSSGLWMTYGVLGRDIILAAPNIIGLPLGLAQIVVYCIYRNKKRQSTDGKWDAPDPEMGLKQSNGVRGSNQEKAASPSPCLEIQMKESEDKPNA